MPGCNVQAITFNLNALVTPQNPERTASVFINNKSVGDINISVAENRPKKFTFKMPDSQDSKYTVLFDISKPTQTKFTDNNSDLLQLGLGFVGMELLANENAVQ